MSDMLKVYQEMVPGRGLVTDPSQKVVTVEFEILVIRLGRPAGLLLD